MTVTNESVGCSLNNLSALGSASGIHWRIELQIDGAVRVGDASRSRVSSLQVFQKIGYAIAVRISVRPLQQVAEVLTLLTVASVVVVKTVFESYHWSPPLVS
jgi:hypothetical protein